MGAYRVAGGRIVDANGGRVRLHGVNWFGFETAEHVVHGLNVRRLRDLLQQMVDLGVNAVRLPFSPPALRRSPITGVDFALNPELDGCDSLDALDAVVAEIDRAGLLLLPDHHRPDDVAISSLWYTSRYSEEEWIADLVFVVERYRHLGALLGIDLKNEPHGSATWGTGNPATDWNRAAERAAAAILAVAPEILIFVEGVEGNPFCSSQGGHWWGGNLEPLECTPLAIPADRLVLSPHVYGPDVYEQEYFSSWRFPRNLGRLWTEHFGRFAADGHALVVGEFGGRCGTDGGDRRDRRWHEALVDYLIANGITDTFYWSWNPDSADTGGVLQDDWRTPWPEKLALLRRLWAAGEAGLHRV